MDKHKRTSLEQQAFDVLREVGNIGAAHATTALAEMMRQPVSMEVPWVELVPFDDVTDELGGPEQIVACVYLRALGEVECSMFFIQPVPAAKQLVSLFLPATDMAAPFTDLELSALAEIGNIMAANYLASLAEFTHLNMYPSVPLVAVDMAQAVLNVGLQQDNPVGNYALIIHATIHHQLASENAHLFLLPDPGTEESLIRALGIGGFS